jgi:hypothetical protein
VLVIALVGYGAARRDRPRAPPAFADRPTNGAKPYLILDLPAAPAGKTWEAWVIHGDTPVRAGITDERGITTLELAAPLGSGDTVAVTAEPPGGVDSPTGPPVLLASRSAIP